MKTSVSISHVLLSLSPSVSEKKTLVCLASTSHRQQLGKDKTEEKLKKNKNQQNPTHYFLGNIRFIRRFETSASLFYVEVSP